MSAPRTCNCMSCQKCRAREYARKTYRARAEGTWNPRGNLAEVRAHIAELRSNDVGITAISRASGVGRATIQRLFDDSAKWVSRDVSDRLLAVTDADGLRVDALGTTRRLQALNALGWSTYRLADELATTQDHVWGVTSGRARFVRQPFRKAVMALYVRLSMQLGPSSISRSRAQSAGYAPPLAWSNIDDPDERPVTRGPRKRSRADVDPVVILRVIAGDRLPMTRAERVAVVAQMSAAGWSQERIEQHTGITRVDRLIQREAS